MLPYVYAVVPMAEWWAALPEMRQFGLGGVGGDDLAREILVAVLNAPFETLDQTCLSISTALLASAILMLTQQALMGMARLSVRGLRLLLRRVAG